MKHSLSSSILLNGYTNDAIDHDDTNVHSSEFMYLHIL